jgi:hypothetical protein
LLMVCLSVCNSGWRKPTGFPFASLVFMNYRIISRVAS